MPPWNIDYNFHSHIHTDVWQELPWGAELLVAGNFNINLSDPEGDRRGGEIAATLVTEGLKDIFGALPPAPALMVLVQKEVEHNPDGEVGEFLDGLHPRDGLPSLL